VGRLSAPVVAATVLVASLHAEQRVLDLTVPVAAHLSGGGEGCAVGESGRKDVELPLEMGLVLDRASYFLGGYVIYDVTLKNSGTRSVTLPWAAGRVSDPSSKLEISLILFTTDDGGRTVALSGTTILGDAHTPETTLLLEPGETARIRVPGVFHVPQSDASRVATVDGVERQIRARMMVSMAVCEWSAPILSSPVTVTMRRTP
jgi:hypothetical protein